MAREAAADLVLTSIGGDLDLAGAQRRAAGRNREEKTLHCAGPYGAWNQPRLPPPQQPPCGQNVNFNASCRFRGVVPLLLVTWPNVACPKLVFGLFRLKWFITL